MLFAYFIYIARLENSHVEAYIASRKIFAHEKIQRENSLGKEKGKKTSPKRKERIPFCQEKKKIFVESDWFFAPRWRPHEVAAQQKFCMHKKRGFLYIYTSTSLNTKILTIASNRNFEIIKKTLPKGTRFSNKGIPSAVSRFVVLPTI